MEMTEKTEISKEELEKLQDFAKKENKKLEKKINTLLEDLKI